MGGLFELVRDQVAAFMREVGETRDVAVCLPAVAPAHFLPDGAEEAAPGVVVLHGALDSGEPCRVVLDAASLPLVLVGVPRPPGRPARPVSFAEKTVRLPARQMPSHGSE